MLFKNAVKGYSKSALQKNPPPRQRKAPKRGLKNKHTNKHSEPDNA